LCQGLTVFPTCDRECGLLANSFAHPPELRLAGEDEFLASLPDRHATKRKESGDSLGLDLMNPALVCGFMSERRSGISSPAGSCFVFDERMNGSAVDLMTLTSTISDLVRPPFRTPDASGRIERKTAKKIARERIRRFLPSNSTVPDVKRVITQGCSTLSIDAPQGQSIGPGARKSDASLRACAGTGPFAFFALFAVENLADDRGG
jgi:hypothetical protein